MGLADLSPAYFGKVMATGIVSIAAQMAGLEAVARGLFVLNTIAYGVLWALFLARMLRFAPRFFGDMTDHLRGPGYFTVVAGTAVLGGQFVVLDGDFRVATVLWFAAIVLWVVLTYTIFAGFAVKEHKPSLDRGISGAWLLAVVSTQSIAVLGALLLVDRPGDALAFACVAAFVLGIVTYLIVMTMVFLRWTFQELEPTEADPPAWIAAGAVAITVLAGSNLLAARAVSPRIERLAPFLEGMVTLAWATATFWFPLMVAIGVWRHIVRRVPLRYNPSYWSLVFPLGMYSAATFKMRIALQLDALEWLPKIALAIALTAWAATAFGLVHLGITAVSARRERPVAPPT